MSLQRPWPWKAITSLEAALPSTSKSRKRATFIVSHILDLLFRICDEIYLLEKVYLHGILTKPILMRYQHCLATLEKARTIIEKGCDRPEKFNIFWLLNVVCRYSFPTSPSRETNRRFCEGTNSISAAFWQLCIQQKLFFPVLLM